MEQSIKQKILDVVKEGKPFTLDAKEGLFIEYLLDAAVNSGRSPKEFLKEFFVKGFGVEDVDADGIAQLLTTFFITSDGKKWEINNAALSSFYDFVGANLALISMLLGTYRGVSLEEEVEDKKKFQYTSQVPVLIGDYGVGKTGWLVYTASPFHKLFNTLGYISLQTGLFPSIYEESIIPTEGGRTKRLLPAMYDEPSPEAQKKIEEGGGIFVFDDILSHPNPRTLMALYNLINAYDKPYERFLIGTAHDPVIRKDVYENIMSDHISSLSTRCAFVNFNVLYANKFYDTWTSINQLSPSVSLILTLPIETLRRFGFTVKEGKVVFDEELFLSENGLTKEHLEGNAPLKALIRFSDLRDKNEIIKKTGIFLNSLGKHGFIYEAFVDYYILMQKLLGVNEDKDIVKRLYSTLESIMGNSLVYVHKEYLMMLVDKIKNDDDVVIEGYNKRSKSLPGFYNMLIKPAFTRRDIESLAVGWGVLLKLMGGVESYTKPYVDYALNFISACNFGDYIGNRLYNAYKGFLFALSKEYLLSIEQIDELAKHLSLGKKIEELKDAEKRAGSGKGANSAIEDSAFENLKVIRSLEDLLRKELKNVLIDFTKVRRSIYDTGDYDPESFGIYVAVSEIYPEIAGKYLELEYFEEKPRSVIFVLDVSGSMETTDLRVAFSVIKSLAEEKWMKFGLIVLGSSLEDAVFFDDLREVEEIKGKAVDRGGGTDMTQALVLVKELGKEDPLFYKKYGRIIFLTDGETPWKISDDNLHKEVKDFLQENRIEVKVVVISNRYKSADSYIRSNPDVLEWIEDPMNLAVINHKYEAGAG